MPTVPSSTPAPTSTHATAAEGTPERPTPLPRELSEFLLQFSISLHRFGIYPAGHPALAPLTESVLARLRLLMLQRPRITLGVAQSQLVIEGVATDRRNPVLQDLAKRLHDHQIGALSFERTLEPSSLQWVFDVLSVHPDRTGEPEGLRPASERPPLPGLTLHPLGYDLLSLQGGELSEWRPEPARAMSLWLGLAQAAMAAAGGGTASKGEAARPGPSASPPTTPPPPTPGGAEVARSLAGSHQESAYEQVIVGYLLQIAEELRTGAGAEVEGVRRRMVELVRELDEETLERILHMGGDTTRLRSFVLDSNEALNLDAVLKLLRAAAGSSQRTMSSSLTRVLTKLALHAERGTDDVRDQAAGAFRETVEELVGNWDSDAGAGAGAPGSRGLPSRHAPGNPAPGSSAPGTPATSISEDYGLLLDTMARAAPVFPLAADGGDPAATRMEGPDGALRLLQTALETDADGPMIDRAVAALIDGGRVVQVLRLTDAWEHGGDDAVPALALRLRRDLATPAELSRLLAQGEIEAGVVAEMAARVGEAALDALLDALENSDSRQVRRRAFDALAGLGEALSRGLAPRIPELAADPRWFVRRNLLSLLRSSGEIPEGFTPLPFLVDADARVRRVALQMAIELPTARDEALRQALADPDEGVARTALLELQSGLPAAAVPVLVREILAPGAHAALRPLAFRALRGCTSRVALDAALAALDGGRSLLGRRRLPAPSAEVREALGLALSPPWVDHADVGWIAAAAAQAREPEYATWVRELAAAP
ncbi:MAG: hypothetical protein EA350_14410 [Gemmatimonadales bacterium]|nr:MAG: hypothetical protein EA350_14410 [Gemmatimonadales bacterium]